MSNITIVGTGIKAVSQFTREAEHSIISSDKLFYLVSDPITEEYLKTLHSNIESLVHFYKDGKHRIRSYYEMVEHVISEAKTYQEVCVAFYGHPGVFVFPSHEIIRIFTEMGGKAEMLPAVSAEDCIFSDLGIDPARHGCSSFEATDFLARGRIYDPTSLLIIWQIGVVGVVTFEKKDYTPKNLKILTEKLLLNYSIEHEVIIYEAAQFPFCKPVINKVPLSQLASSKVSAISTLVVPPLINTSKYDTEILKKLGISEKHMEICVNSKTIKVTTFE